MKTSSRLLILILTLGIFASMLSVKPASASGSNWHIKYYSDPAICNSLNCEPTQVFCEKEIGGDIFHMDYPSDGRACNTGNDHWGSIYKSVVNFPEGNYVFHTTGDDGVKLFVASINNGNAISDLGLSETDHKVCPAIHLNGDYAMTVIHTNTSGGAYVNVWWNTDTSACVQNPADLVLPVKTGADGRSWVTLENTTTKPLVHIWQNGAETISRDLWNVYGNSLWMYVPDQADSFLVEGATPQIWSGSETSWLLNGRWIMRRAVKVNKYTVTYTRGSALPVNLGYIDGRNETRTDLWSTNNGTDYTFVIPQGVSVIEILGGSRPEINDWPSYLFKNDSLTRKIFLKMILVEYDSSTNGSKVTYFNNIPPSMVGIHYYLENDNREYFSTDWWIQVDGFLHFLVPENVASFVIDNGPNPFIFDNLKGYWKVGPDGRWLIRLAHLPQITSTPTITATPSPTLTPQPTLTATPSPSVTPTIPTLTPTPVVTTTPSPLLDKKIYLPIVRK